MAYEVLMPYHLHMPSYFLGTFTEYPYEVANPYRQIDIATGRKRKEMNRQLFISFSNFFIRSKVFPASVDGKS